MPALAEFIKKKKKPITRYKHSAKFRADSDKRKFWPEEVCRIPANLSVIGFYCYCAKFFDHICRKLFLTGNKLFVLIYNFSS